MKLLDSSVWIEHLTGGARLSTKHASLFADSGGLIVSTINLYEVGRYVLRTSGEEMMEEVLVSLGQCRVVPPTPAISRAAVLLAAKAGLHMADALIAATALLEGAELLTFDVDLLRVPGARKP